MDTINNNTSTVLAKKKGKGRVKIALDKKIEKKANLQVTFSKRRKGLFSKAAELSILTGAQIAIIVRSPAGKIFSFESGDSVIRRYQKELEEEDGWWNKPIEAMDLEQLQNYAMEIDKLRAQFNS